MKEKNTMKYILDKKTTSIGLLATFAAICATAPVQAASLKKIVAVSRFENKSAYVNGGQVMIDDGLPDQLVDALMKSGEFVVVERATLDDVKGEQALANSGQAAKSQSAQRGKLTSAQILIKGTVTEFSAKSSGNGNGYGFGPVHVNNGKSVATVGLNIRLIDTTTGQVVASQTVEGHAETKSSGVSVNTGMASYGQKNFDQTPMGKATHYYAAGVVLGLFGGFLIFWKRK